MKIISSADYRYIPIENVFLIAEKDKKIKTLEKQLKALRLDNLKLRCKNEKTIR